MVTYTTRNQFEKPTTGTLPSTWGDHEANFKDRVDEATDGALNIAVNGSITMTVSTGTDDQFHFAAINVIGGVGGSITLPLQQSIYTVYNGATGNVTFLNGGATNTVVLPGQLTQIFNDGINSVRQVGWDGGNLRTYVDNILIQSKAYTDNAEFSSAAGSFPGQTGNAGKYLTTDGLAPSWNQLSIANVAGTATLITDIANTKALAISLAALI